MRRATQADVPMLLELGKAMHLESRFRRFKMNEAKVFQRFSVLVKHPAAIMLVDGEPVHAMLVAFVQPFWWGDELESFDELLYVTPEKRGTSSGVRLVNAYKQIVLAAGVVDPKINTGTGVETERTGKLFEHLGWELTNLGFTLKETPKETKQCAAPLIS